MPAFQGISFPPGYGASGGRSIYSPVAGGEAIVGNGSTARVSMLPTNILNGAASIALPANSLPVGSFVHLVGTGLIGARLTMPPGFNLVPWVKPGTGAVVDLPGFAQAPLLGADGFCEIWIKFGQTTSGLRTSGVVRYGTQGGMPYSITINPGTVSVLPTIVASDPTVDRTIGIDGFWGSGADTREYVRCRAISASIHSTGN